MLNDSAIGMLGVPNLTAKTVGDRLREFRDYRRRQGLEMCRERPVPYAAPEGDPPPRRASVARTPLDAASRRVGQLQQQHRLAVRPESRERIAAEIVAARALRDALKLEAKP